MMKEEKRPDGAVVCPGCYGVRKIKYAATGREANCLRCEGTGYISEVDGPVLEVELCPACEGSGSGGAGETGPCPACSGSGQNPGTKKGVEGILKAVKTGLEAVEKEILSADPEADVVRCPACHGSGLGRAEDSSGGIPGNCGNCQGKGTVVPEKPLNGPNDEIPELQTPEPLEDPYTEDDPAPDRPEYTVRAGVPAIVQPIGDGSDPLFWVPVGDHYEQIEAVRAGDDFLDPSTGEVLGIIPPADQFRVDTVEALDWVLGKVAKYEGQLAAVVAQYGATLTRLEQEKRRLSGTLEFFRTAWSGDIKDLLERELPRTKAGKLKTKFLKRPDGIASLRSTKDGFTVEDDTAAAGTLKWLWEYFNNYGEQDLAKAILENGVTRETVKVLKSNFGKDLSSWILKAMIRFEALSVEAKAVIKPLAGFQFKAGGEFVKLKSGIKVQE